MALRLTLFPALLLLGGCVPLLPYERLIVDDAPKRLLSIAGREVYVEDRGEGPEVDSCSWPARGTRRWRTSRGSWSS